MLYYKNCAIEAVNKIELFLKKVLTQTFESVMLGKSPKRVAINSKKQFQKGVDTELDIVLY